MRTGVGWDIYFHNICKVVSSNCKCLSRKIGAILVRDNLIISTGYNGPPRGVQPCDERWLTDINLQKAAGFKKSDVTAIYHDRLEGICPRYIPEMGFKSGEGLGWCVAGHAERNTLINAAREGIRTKDAILYMNCGIPCTPCLVEIINAGIKEIVVTKIAFYDISSQYLLEQSDLKVRVFDHLIDNVDQASQAY